MNIQALVVIIYQKLKGVKKPSFKRLDLIAQSLEIEIYELFLPKEMI